MAFNYNTAKDEVTASRTFDLDAKHPAQICAQSVSVSSTGNLMINLAWEVLSGSDVGKKIRPDRIVLAAGSIDRLDQFMTAIGKDAATEFGGKNVDEAFLTRWAESLLGETATLSLRMSKATEQYPAKIEVKSYAPFSDVSTGTSDIDLD